MPVETKSLIDHLNTYLEEKRSQNQIENIADWMIINELNRAGFIDASIKDNRQFALNFQSGEQSFSVVPNRKSRLKIHKIRVDRETTVLDPLGSEAIGMAAGWILSILEQNPSAIFTLNLEELPAFSPPKAIILDSTTNFGSHAGFLKEVLKKKGYIVVTFKVENLTDTVALEIIGEHPDLLITDQKWEKDELLAPLATQEKDVAIYPFDTTDATTLIELVQGINRIPEIT
jgi:hypothetical protein